MPPVPARSRHSLLFLRTGGAAQNVSTRGSVEVKTAPSLPPLTHSCTVPTLALAGLGGGVDGVIPDSMFSHARFLVHYLALAGGPQKADLLQEPGTSAE